MKSDLPKARKKAMRKVLLKAKTKAMQLVSQKDVQKVLLKG